MTPTLQFIPIADDDAEKPCYVVDKDTKKPFLQGSDPVLQDCILVTKQHLKNWEPSGVLQELTIDEETGEFVCSTVMNWGPKAEKLLMGEGVQSILDLANVADAYVPFVFIQAFDTFTGVSDYKLPKKNELKLLAIYTFADGAPPKTYIISVASRGFGMGDIGAARADKNSELDYFWFGNPAFGYAMGLALDNYKGKVPYSFDKLPTGWIQYRNFGEDHKWYRVCDTSLSHEAKTRPLYPTFPEVILYKRFLGKAENLYPRDEDTSKNAEWRNKKNRPYQPRGVRLVRMHRDGEGVIQKSEYKTIITKKRKGRKFNKESDPLKVMEYRNALEKSPGIEIHKSGTGRGAMPTLPTATANKQLEKNKYLRQIVEQRLGSLEEGKLRTDQQWCHLVASSLGGTEEYANFVLGSDHCNTEQLAIETALLFNVDKVKKAKRKLKLKLSAYLFSGSTLLADIIRYKILIDDDLLLDHLIDAQSESFSFFEYKILQATTRRLIAVALGEEEIGKYEESINNRIKARMKKDENAPENLTYSLSDYFKKKAGN